MDPIDRPFTTFVRDSRPLSVRLDQWITPISQALERLRTTTDVRRFIAEDLERLIVQVRPEIPTIGGARPARIGEPDFVRVADRHVRATRHHVALEVRGNPIFLGYWPDNSDGLRPVDDPEWRASELTVENRDDIWRLAQVSNDAHPDLWGLYTYVDLTEDEEAAVDSGRLDLNTIFAERRARIEPIVERIRAEMFAYFNDYLPGRLGEILDSKRQEFTVREGVTASLHFPEEWRLPPPQLQAVAPSDLDEPAQDAVAQAAHEIAVPFTPRLSPASFEDVQRTIRVWASAMERYPRAFAALGEDPISDLLAATLNATLPAAHREVYTRKGKSDIFIQADVLDAGVGPERVFIAETKWARSTAIAKAALDPQLFGYLTASDTAAVLLLLLPQQNHIAAVERYLGELKKVEGFHPREALSRRRLADLRLRARATPRPSLRRMG